MSSEVDMFANSEEIDKSNEMEVEGEHEIEENSNVEVDTNKIEDKDSENYSSAELGGDEENSKPEENSSNILTDKSNVPDDTENGEEDADGTPSKESSTKLFRFPQGRIKSIMKLDPDVGMVNGDALFLVNKAVEEFIQCLAVESYHHTASSKKKTIMKEHVMTAIESIDELAFLDGAMED